MPFRLIRDDLRVYLLLNALAYGMVVIGMAAALLFPDLNAARLESMDSDGTTDLVTSLLSNPPLFAATIFAVNVGTVAVASILLPSMIVPFLGIAIFAVRALLIGMTLAPVDQTTAITLIPHSLTIIIEMQAYVVLMLGAFVLGRAWVRPASVDASDRRAAYVRGLQRFGWVGIPAIALLVVGAVYEAFSLTYLVPLLLR